MTSSLAASIHLTFIAPPSNSNPSSLLSHFSQNPLSSLRTSITSRRTHSPVFSPSIFKPPQDAVGNSSSATTIDASTDQNLPTLTLRDICTGHVPEHVLHRMEEVGFIVPTDVQGQALPALFSGRDCILHAQTGSGKTLTYLLLIFSVLNTQRSTVQALIIVPSRELGIQVTKVARLLAAKSMELEMEQKSFTVMALLDGGMLRRHKTWLKAEPPAIVVATIGSLCQMLENQVFKIDSLRVLVIDEVDFMFNSSKQVSLLRKLLTLYTSCSTRQTILASASIPQHRHFLYDCIQQKWTRSDALHVHVNPVQPMPASITHRFMVCQKNNRHQTLLSLLQLDAAESGIVFVGEQSEKSKKAGNPPPTTQLLEFLKSSYSGCSDILLLEEDMNFNSRAAALLELRQKGSYLLVATEIAARGIDLPETTHIYNFDLPRNVVDYLHRAGRTSRKPFCYQECCVTSIITSEERFVLQRYENELMFQCQELLV